MLPALVFVIRLQRQLVGLLWLKSHSSSSWLSSFAYQSVCFKSAIVRDARDPDFCMCLFMGLFCQWRFSMADCIFKRWLQNSLLSHMLILQHDLDCPPHRLGRGRLLSLFLTFGRPLCMSHPTGHDSSQSHYITFEAKP